MPDDSPTQSEKEKKLDSLVREIKLAMFTTTDDDSGRLYSRPMHLQGGLDGGHLYFFTYRESSKVDDLKQDRQVNCGFSNPDDNAFVSCTGRASITTDRNLMRDKWAEPLKAWFPQGIDTDGICLIDVTVEDAQYWDSRNQTMVHAYGILKAAITGEGVKDPGENEKLSLKK